MVIAGPTATGKTPLSLRLAASLGESGFVTEVISADSRQVYRGMDIGTAKVTPAERGRVPHHGLDLVDPDAPFSLVDFVDHARAALDRIAARGGAAILVGGTGLYLRAVARGLDSGALPSDRKVRDEIEAELETHGLEAAVERLRAEAPIRAAAVDVRNPRRVARALEIARLAGDGVAPPLRGYAGPSLWLGLTLEPAENRRRIAARAQAQFRGGLLDEARGLLDRYPRDLRSFSAIGYPEAFAVVSGERSLEAALDATIDRTAAFARRQRTWFRAEPGIDWIDATDSDPYPQARALVDRLLAPA